MTLRSVAYTLVVLLALAVLLGFGAEFLTLSAPVLKNYNEGWNAYHAAAALADPRTLYPASSSFLTNNYPPLSFFVTGALTRISGLDGIVVGRILAFVSTLGIGLCLGFAARAFGCNRFQSAVAALLFWAAPWVLVKFAAMDDPQMLGNLLDAIALLAIARGPRSRTHLITGALLLTAAEFVKPLYVTLPLALLVWLCFYERRSAWLLAGFGLLFAVLGYALTALTLHVELLHYIFSPRVFLLSKLTGQPGQWLLVEALPFAAALSLFRRKGDGAAFFAAAYAAIAFALAVIFSGGDGVSASQMMDASMAAALGAALYLNRFETAGWNVPALGFVAVLQSVMLILSLLGHWALRPSLPDLMATRYATTYDVGVIAHHGEPVLCETLALCYWAGHTPQMDAFGFAQGLKRGARKPDDFIRLLDRRAYSMIQLQPQSVFFPPSPLWAAIVRNYYLEHEDKNGLFLIPRT